MDDRFPGWGRAGEGRHPHPFCSASQKLITQEHLGKRAECILKDSRSSQCSRLEVGAFHRGGLASLVPRAPLGERQGADVLHPQHGREPWGLKRAAPGSWESGQAGGGGRVLSAGTVPRPGCGGSHNH